MGYFTFYREFPRLLTVLLLFTFFSSFGQTFFLSLYQPHLTAMLGWTPGQMGALYSGATLLSALCLPWFGRLMDRLTLRQFGLLVIGGLGGFCLFGTLVVGPVMVFTLFFGLRLFGQGLSTNVAMTAAVRLFRRRRGMASGLAGIGWPLGEAVFPLLFSAFILAWGWRAGFGLSGLLVLGVFLPVFLYLMHSPERTEVTSEELAEERENRAQRSFGKIIADPRFIYLSIAGLPLGFIGTGYLLFQADLSASKGWGPHVFPIALFVFALVRAGVAIFSGRLVDRLTARRMLAWQLYLLALGLGVLYLFDGVWAGILFFVTIGASFGVAMTVMSAVWAEVFPLGELGTLRGVQSSLGVLTTAAAPVIFGVLLDLGIPLETAAAGFGLMLAALGLVYSFPSGWLIKRS